MTTIGENTSARGELGRLGRGAAGWLALLGSGACAGCDGAQSALDPAGRGAEQLASLFWWMAGGAGVIWLLVIGLMIYAARVPAGAHPRRTALLIIGGGAIFPTVVLAVLLSYGLALLPELLAPAPEGSLRVAVTGEQWWWRVQYESPSGEPVELANEIHLPVGEPVEFHLESADVIHAFWIPALGGKMDMVPGRRTRLTLTPTRTGVYRGACAEFCGASHALMAFDVVVHEKEEFQRWLAAQAAPAASPATPQAARGQELFLAHGCGACHTVRGTPARGALGPDLTHVGGRRTLAAGTLANQPQDFERWLAHTRTVKPDVIMPHFGMLSAEDLRALASYLEALQ